MRPRLRPGRTLCALAALAAAACAEPPPPPNVVLVTLDTTRIDHLSAYGYERTTSPQLGRLAAEGVRYTRAWSTSSWTLPAHASLFTGLYPAAHGAHFDVAGAVGLGALRAGRLDERFVTLAELLAQRGYATGAFVGGPWLLDFSGLLQGFDTRDAELRGLHGRRAGPLTDAALAWLADLAPQRPFLLFVNYFDPHAPYDPPPGFDDYPAAGTHPEREDWWVGAISGERPVSPGERAAMIDRYDGEIRYMDHHLGRLLDALRAREGWERTLVVVTADHGESFGEGGRWVHNTHLSEEQVRVPFVVRYPAGARAGEEDDTPLQLVDVLPLVAREAGVTPPADVQGVAPGARAQAFLELYRNGQSIALYGDAYDRDLFAAVDWPWKLVETDGGARRLARIRGLADEQPQGGAADESARLAALLEAHRRDVGRTAVQHPVVDEATRESLRALGYVE